MGRNVAVVLAVLLTCIVPELGDDSKSPCFTTLPVASALWRFLGDAQELVLLSAINSSNVSQGLVQTFQGIGFANFAVLDLLLGILPVELRGESGASAERERFQYHPYIFFVQQVL